MYAIVVHVPLCVSVRNRLASKAKGGFGDLKILSLLVASFKLMFLLILFIDDKLST